MSKRTWHYIKHNSVCETPANAIWFDTETVPETQADGSIVHRLQFGWLCYMQRGKGNKWRAPQWRRFTTAREFWDHVYSFTRTKTTIYLFCHNTNFDLPVLDCFNLPRSDGWELRRAVIDAPPTILHLRKGSSKLVILDTLNFWRVPLADLGKSIGHKKLPMPPAGASQEEWDTYCKQDVEVIRQAMLHWWQFLVDNDMGGFAPTLAGQSMRIWRHRYMKDKVLIDCDENALKLARDSYCGGRNECFKHGRIEGPIYYIDINSMYPSVMHGRKYPARLLGFDNSVPEATYLKYHRSHCCISRVKIRTTEPVFPKIIDGRLCFPVGEFEVALAGPELDYAVSHGCVLEWYETVVYHAAELFTEFVGAFYKRRLEARDAGNDVLSFFYKILLNSLYGKYGQRGMVWEESAQIDDLSSKSWTEYDTETGKFIHWRQLAGLVQAKSQAGESSDSMPAIPAYVCSYARMDGWRLMCQMGRENVLYTDTDGFFVTQAGYERIKHLIDPLKLGAPKLEAVADFIEIRCLKDYTFGDTKKTKGVKKKAVWLSESEVRQEQWSGLQGQLSRGQLDKAVTKTVPKKLTRAYTKGTFMPDGSVTPITLGP